MSNSVTNRLNIVKEEKFKRIPLINDVISTSLMPLRNSNQEVFRGNAYQGVVYSSTNQHIYQAQSNIKVYNGDIIYYVTMLSQPDTIVGTLSTKDQYKRIYDWSIQVVVNDSRKVVEVYRMGVDPANSAIGEFKASFERYVQSIDHDQINISRLPMDEWNEGLTLNFGIQIISYTKPMFREDAARTKLLTTRFELRNSMAVLENEAVLREFKTEMEYFEESKRNEYQREESAKKNTFDRQEETKKHIHSLRKQFRTAAASELIVILKERIHEGYEIDRPMKEISSEYISLMDAFDEKFHVGRENALFSGAFEYDADEHDEIDTPANVVDEDEDESKVRVDKNY